MSINKSLTDNLLFHYDMGNYKSWKGGPTTNLLPTGTINSYPSVGNAHGTYNTNQYVGDGGNNTDFNIGTITSVVDNLVTFVPSAHEINTYDCLNIFFTYI